MSEAKANKDPEIMTSEEVAEYLRVSLDTIRDLVNAGALPCLKITCRLWRFYRSDVNEFLMATRKA